MKHVVALVLRAGLCVAAGLGVSGCGGGHHTATEPAASLHISALLPQPIIRYQDRSQADLPIKFDFTAPDGNLSLILVAYGGVTETTPARGVAGLTAGSPPARSQREVALVHRPGRRCRRPRLQPALGKGGPLLKTA